VVMPLVAVIVRVALLDGGCVVGGDDGGTVVRGGGVSGACVRGVGVTGSDVGIVWCWC